MYIEIRFDNNVQCDPMIHFCANFYRLYCLFVFFFLIAKLNSKCIIYQIYDIINKPSRIDITLML
jgi:hypothetical protein